MLPTIGLQETEKHQISGLEEIQELIRLALSVSRWAKKLLPIFPTV